MATAPANECNIFHSRHDKFTFGDKFLLMGILFLSFARSLVHLPAVPR